MTGAGPLLDFGDGYSLRQATAADHAALSLVCLRTGDAGRDATGREDDPALLGLVFAIPYQIFEPDLAFVVVGPGGVWGYLVGAHDTEAFNDRLATEWYPGLRERVSDPGDDPARWQGSNWLRSWIHRPDLASPEPLRAYPSHCHIDLLPEARGRGIGRKAITFLEDRLRASGSAGLHLEVDPRNADALAFYQAIGFRRLHGDGIPDRSTYVVKAL